MQYVYNAAISISVKLPINHSYKCGVLPLYLPKISWEFFLCGLRMLNLGWVAMKCEKNWHGCFSQTVHQSFCLKGFGAVRNTWKKQAIGLSSNNQTTKVCVCLKIQAQFNDLFFVFFIYIFIYYSYKYWFSPLWKTFTFLSKPRKLEISYSEKERQRQTIVDQTKNKKIKKKKENHKKTWK